jgi:hypothetical protein
MAVVAGDIYAVAGTKQAGYTGNGGPATTAELNGPADVSVSPSGHLVVADNGNNVLRLIAGPPPPMPTVARLKPTSGPTSGNRKVTIVGANLSGTTAVLFGSRPAQSFVVKSAKKIVAFSPTASVGRVTVTVVTSTGASLANTADSYTYLLAAPPKKHRHKL